jgi:preprotein translocase subunit SecB
VTEARAEAPPKLYPIQLVEVHCATVRAEYKNKGEVAPSEEVAVRLAITPLDDSRRAFGCRLEVGSTVPSALIEDEVADVFVVVQGTFNSESEIDDDLYATFIQFTPVALLWPYARAYVAQIAQMVGLMIPPLPSLDVLGLGNQGNEADSEA